MPSGNLAMGWGPWSSRNRAEESSHFPDFSYLTSSPSPFLSHSSSAPPCGVGLMGTRFGPSISLSDETQKHIHDQIGCCSSLVHLLDRSTFLFLVTSRAKVRDSQHHLSSSRQTVRPSSPCSGCSRTLPLFHPPAAAASYARGEPAYFPVIPTPQLSCRRRQIHSVFHSIAASYSYLV